MAHLIIGDGISSGDPFVPGQLFLFGSIVLHANPTYHLDLINNFTPEHRIRFSNLEYVADARGNLVLAGFTSSADLVFLAPELFPDPIYRSASIL